MKKFKAVAVALVLLTLLSVTAPVFANPLMSGPVIDYIEHYDNLKRVINKGEQIDLSTAAIEFIYEGGSAQTLKLDNNILSELPNTNTPGLKRVYFNLNNIDFEISFVVIDDSKTLSHFTDVKRNYWGYNVILRCVKAQFLQGVSKTLFSPLGKMTRAEFCQMLYNIYKNDDVMKPKQTLTFTDTDENAWYYKAVCACANAGIVSGIGGGRFDPSGLITRQDVCVMLMRIIYGAQYVDSLDAYKTLENARQNGCAAVDFDTCSDYAKNSVAAALCVILNGNEKGEIYPRAQITRAECAAIISNYLFIGYTDPVIKPLVYLSPSNQMNNLYAGMKKENGGTEGVQMTKLAVSLGAELEKMGYEVYIAEEKTPIKGDDKFIRADEAESLGADCYIALHSNAAGVTNSGKYQGAKAFYNGNNKGAKELSQCIMETLSEFTPTKDNGIENDMLAKTPFAEVRHPKMANLILEVEFHDYAPYALWITQNIDPMAKVIAKGIDNYFQKYDY